MHYRENGNFKAYVAPIYCTGTEKLQSSYDNCDSDLYTLPCTHKHQTTPTGAGVARETCN